MSSPFPRGVALFLNYAEGPTITVQVPPGWLQPGPRRRQVDVVMQRVAWLARRYLAAEFDGVTPNLLPFEQPGEEFIALSFKSGSRGSAVPTGELKAILLRFIQSEVSTATLPLIRAYHFQLNLETS